MPFQNPAIWGKKCPDSTPINIAVKIHMVRYLSKKDSFFLFEAIIHIQMAIKSFRLRDSVWQEVNTET